MSVVASLLTALSSNNISCSALQCVISIYSSTALPLPLLHLHNSNYNHSPTQARALQPRGGEANNLNGRSPLGGSVGSVPRLVTICLAKYWGVEESPSTFLSEDESLLSCNLEGTLQQRRIIYLREAGEIRSGRSRASYRCIYRTKPYGIRTRFRI